MVLLAGLKNNEAFLDMILRPQACAGISLQQQRSEKKKVVRPFTTITLIKL
jgi:uncharacterized membrane protein